MGQGALSPAVVTPRLKTEYARTSRVLLQGSRIKWRHS